MNRYLTAAALAPPLAGAALLLANPATAITPVLSVHVDVWAIPVACGHYAAPSAHCQQVIVSRDGKRSHYDLQVGQWCQEDTYTGTPPSSPLVAPTYNTGDRRLLSHRNYACGPTEEQPSPTPSSTPSPTGSPSPSPSASETPSASASVTPPASEQPSATPSALPTPTESGHPLPTPTDSGHPVSPSGTPSPSGTAPAGPVTTPAAPSTTPTPSPSGSTPPKPPASTPSTTGTTTLASTHSTNGTAPTPPPGTFPRPASPARSVTPGGVQPTGRVLAHTGADSIPQLLFAGLLLVAVGAFAARAARRRRS